MLVILPFYSGDKKQAVELSEWILELGGVSKHDCILCHDKRTNTDGILDTLSKSFKSVTTIVPYDAADSWPAGPNRMFDYTCRYISELVKKPFLWIEPDAIPLKSNWLDKIEEEYNQCGKPFMGQYVNITDTYKDGINHMSGVAVYPHNVIAEAPSVLNNITVAWDIVGALEILPKFYDTKLIQHTWKAQSFKDVGSLCRLREEAVIFHQNKDGSLIKYLRESKTNKPSNLKELVQKSVEVTLSETIKEVPETIASNTVYTFYDPLPELQDEKLMRMWQQNWRAYGWEPVVLTLKDAQSWDGNRFEKYKSSQNLYEGKCKRDYVFRCYTRWIPLAYTGGVMVDFDVFNYGFTPKMYEDLRNNLPSDRIVHLSGDATPCATFGTSSAYMKLIEAFDAYNDLADPKTPHLKQNVHDQNILDANPKLWTGIKFCSLYPDEELWSKYPLTHFTHGKVSFPRSSKIRVIRNFEPVPRKTSKVKNSLAGV